MAFQLYTGSIYGKWIKVDEKKTLLDVLQHTEYIIPTIPGVVLFFSVIVLCGNNLPIVPSFFLVTLS